MAYNTVAEVLRMHEKYKENREGMIQSLKEIFAYQDEQIKNLEKLVNMQQDYINLLKIQNTKLKTK